MSVRQLFHKKRKERTLSHGTTTSCKQIGVIETIMLCQCQQDPKKHQVVSVFTLLIEESSRHIVLTRFYEDFREFDKRLKSAFRRRNKACLPTVRKCVALCCDHEHKPTLSRESHNSGNAHQHVFQRKAQRLQQGLLKNFPNLSKRKSCSQCASSYHAKRNNAFNASVLETYLRYCIDDKEIGSSTLLEDFLRPQREPDHIILKDELSLDYYLTTARSTNSIITTSATSEIAEEIKDKPLLPNLNFGLAHTLDDSDTKSTSSLPLESPRYNEYSPLRRKSVQLAQKQAHHSLSSTTSLSVKVPNSTPVVNEGNQGHHRTLSIENFHFIKVIGRGCMGKVFLVRHKATKQLFALKAINKRTVVEQNQSSHIKAELRILADISSLNHPFLIKLHFAFRDPNYLFLVLDYHVGGDLATQLRLHHKLEPQRCLFYIAEITLGLQQLHRMNILYRDLKPENILLTVDGHIILTDFGLSKQFPYLNEPYVSEKQKTSTFCGTAEYIAPEILKQEPYSYEVDYWSMGTILYEMLTGVTPFWAENRDEMFRRIREDPLQFPAFIDIETVDFIARLLRRDPKRRLGSGPDGPLLVRSDPYFDTIDWNLLYARRIKPPYRPELESEMDFSLFDSEFLQLTPRLSPVAKIQQQEEMTKSQQSLLSDPFYLQQQEHQDCFEGYSFVVNEDEKNSSAESIPSKIYSMVQGPPIFTLMDTAIQQGTVVDRNIEYFIYSNESEDMIAYDENVDIDHGNMSSDEDNICPADFLRNDYQNDIYAYGNCYGGSSSIIIREEAESAYPIRPARPVVRSNSDSPSLPQNQSISNLSNATDSSLSFKQ